MSALSAFASPAPAFLASVASPDEIAPALAGGAEIVDLKDPARGALGAWELETIREAVACVSGRCPVSATVGDLPMTPDLVAERVRATAGAGVDFVKVGLFAAPGRAGCIAALDGGASGAALVAVLFADLYPVRAVLPELRGAKIAGVMLDTARKDGRSLREIIGDAEIAEFIAAARDLGFFVGLAGALRAADIAPLAGLDPDLLGFRGALCAGSRRTQALDPARVRNVAALVRTARDARHASSERHATLTAGAMLPAE